MELLRSPLGREPALEIALASSLLSAVAAGEQPPVLRIYSPPATVAFGRRDAFLPGFATAVATAREHGFEPALRAQGGRAAAYDESCLIVDEIMPSTDSMSGIQDRFAQDAERHARTLRGLGVDARVGEVPGEYCPGPFTVNARGERKLVGSAQRIKRGGWLLSSVVVVDGAARLRAVLEDVYASLGLGWDPASVGSVADEAPGVTVETVEDALLASYAERYALRAADLAAGVLEAARAELARHVVGPS